MKKIGDNCNDYSKDIIKKHISLSNEPLRVNFGQPEHQYIQIKYISDFIDILKNLIIDQRKKVLLVCDIDDTIIRPIVDIGSEAWFSFSLKHEQIDNVLDKLGMIYAILNFQCVEEDTNNLISLIKDLSNPSSDQLLTYLCLTSRNVRFHSHTATHLYQANYDKTMIRQNMLEIDNSMCIFEQITPYGKQNIPLVRYIDNICFTSGTDKGIVLDEILNRYFKKNQKEKMFDTIVFIDDSKINTDSVHGSLMNITKKYHIDSLCVHYTFMQEQKNNYSVNHYIDDTKKIDKLIEAKEHINTKRIVRSPLFKILKFMCVMLLSFAINVQLYIFLSK